MGNLGRAEMPEDKRRQAESVANDNDDSDGRSQPYKARGKTVACLNDGASSEQLAALWGRVASRIRAELGDDLFSSWFARIEPVAFRGGVLSVTVPTPFLRTWLNTHYCDQLHDFWAAGLNGLKRLDIGVRARGTPVHQKNTGLAAGCAKGALDQPVIAGVTARRQLAAKPANSNLGRMASPLGHDMSFATFAVGKSNALAHAAAERVADAAPSSPISFNPLYIHSASGFGKTHLLQAIAGRIRSNHPDRRVLYLTAERFMYRFIAALKAKDMLSFKDHFQDTDVLLIDDFQFLQGRSMQQEFCHTVNSLVDSRRQVIVTADMPPLQLEGIDERIRSRLGGGLVVDIEPADYELRLRIVKMRLAEMQHREPTLQIPDPVLEFIAQRMQGGGRALEGALTRIAAHRQLTNSELTVEMASVALRDLLNACTLKRIKIDDIQRVVGKHYNVSRSDLLSARRARSIVRPRQIGMFLSKRLTTRSLPEIGRRFGGRDHSTVLHAIRKVQELIGKDEKLAREVELLIRLLET